MKNASDITVAIFGGGVAGMSAAHELAERGFKVKVYEKQESIPGGKARSMPVEGTGLEGRRDLPGEHGFRFFPRFYRHIVDTMRRIPFADNPNGVADNLVDTTRALFSILGQQDVMQPTKFPQSLADLKEIYTFLQSTGYPNLREGEYDLYKTKMLQAMTSCTDRIEQEYEGLSAWDYLESDGKSTEFHRLFSDQARVLVAANPKYMSARVAAKVNAQLFFGVMTPGDSTDRVLNGPSNDVWIDPWYNYLVSLGVEYHFGQQIQALQLGEDGQISSATVSGGGDSYQVEADYYLLALPVEVANQVINQQLQQAAPSLSGISKLADDVAWMNGIMYYLKEPIDIVSGHTFYAGSPWAITSIEQHKYWQKYNLENYGDGTTKGILSIDISDWETPGLLHQKPARECTPWEIAEEVWYQIKTWLGDKYDAHPALSDDLINNWFIDTDIKRDETISHHYENSNDEPLLINKPNTWKYRPEAITEISNLMLASDYVRNNTELATMEGANEAARRAVNGIISDSGLAESTSLCDIWPLQRPAFLEPLIALDQQRFNQGLPWKNFLQL